MIAPMGDLDEITSAQLMETDERGWDKRVGGIRQVARFGAAKKSAIARGVEPASHLTFGCRGCARHAARRAVEVSFLRPFSRLVSSASATEAIAAAAPTIATEVPVATPIIAISPLVSGASVESIIPFGPTASLDAFAGIQRWRFTAFRSFCDPFGAFLPVATIDGAIEIAASPFATILPVTAWSSPSSCGASSTPSSTGFVARVVGSAGRAFAHAIEYGADIRNRSRRR